MSMSINQSVLTVIYSLLFVIGLSGNVWVMKMCVQVSKGQQRRRTEPMNSIMVYVLALSIVDTGVMLCIPFLLSDFISGYWMWGNLICKLYMSMESTNKFMSTFILTAVSVDRYLTVCHSRTSHSVMRSPYIIVSGCVVLALVLLSPLQISAGTSQAYSTLRNENLTKCGLDMSLTVYTIFTTQAFIVGYCIPAVIITMCYSQLLSFTAHRDRGALVRTRIPLRKVIMSSLSVVAFYYAVWTPFWAITLNMIFQVFTGTFIFRLSMYVHILPYVSSAFNWVLYALLNKQLRKSYADAVQKKNKLIANRKLSEASFYPEKTSFKINPPTEAVHKSTVSSQRNGSLVPIKEENIRNKIENNVNMVQLNDDENDGSNDAFL